MIAPNEGKTNTVWYWSMVMHGWMLVDKYCRSSGRWGKAGRRWGRGRRSAYVHQRVK